MQNQEVLSQLGHQMILGNPRQLAASLFVGLLVSFLIGCSQLNTVQSSSYLESPTKIIYRNLIAQANAAKEKGAYADELAIYNKALPFVEKNGSPIMQSDLYRKMGVAYKNLKQFDEAEAHILKALHLIENTHDKEGIAACYDLLGLIFYQQGNSEKALHYYKQSIPFNQASGHQDWLDLAYIELGRLYEQKHDYLNAINYFEKSMELSRANPNTSAELLAEKELVLAEEYHKLGNYPTAIEHYRKAITKYAASGNKKGEAYALAKLAAAYAASKKSEPAIDALKKSIVLFKELHADYIVERLTKYLNMLLSAH